MDFNTYQDEAGKTAVYPDSLEVIYPALGAADETFEFLEKSLRAAIAVGRLVGKTKKFARGDFGIMLSEEVKDGLKKEMGDVLWYLSSLARDLSISFDDVAAANIKKLHKRREEGTIQGSGDDR